MIKLTDWNSVPTRTIWLNNNHIVTVSQYGECTEILLSNNNHMFVFESVKEVLRLIEMADPNWGKE